MSMSSRDIFDFITRFRAELAPRDGLEEILVDGLVSTAVRLKRLYADERATEPFDNEEWDRAHDLASRAFFRHYDRLQRGRRAPAQASKPRPARALPAELQINRPGLTPSLPSVQEPNKQTPPTNQSTTAQSTPAPAEPTTPTPHQSPRRRPDPEKLLRRERERRKREQRDRREHRATEQVHPMGFPATSPARASPAA